MFLPDRSSITNSPSKNTPELGPTMVLTLSSSLTPHPIPLATLPPQEALMLLELRPLTLSPTR